MLAIEAVALYQIFREVTLETIALRGASLSLPAGTWTSLIGPSGSGKSTLLQVMAGLIEPSGGQVLIEGTDLTRLPADERARRRGRSIGVVLQRDNLHPLLDLAANVQLPLRLAGVGARAASARADALLDQIGLVDRRHHYPSDVSGGEAQRAAVAAALAPHPAVLLADEPTGELDEPTARSVLDLLGKARDMGAAVLTVTHNPAVADRAERTLMMLDGIVAYA